MLIEASVVAATVTLWVVVYPPAVAVMTACPTAFRARRKGGCLPGSVDEGGFLVAGPLYVCTTGFLEGQSRCCDIHPVDTTAFVTTEGKRKHGGFANGKGFIMVLPTTATRYGVIKQFVVAYLEDTVTITSDELLA